MREMLQSLSLTSGAIVLAAISGFVAYLTSGARNLKAGAIVGVLVSGVLSYSLYWAPVWLGANGAEYSSWALLVVAAWFIAGVAGAFAACFLLRWRRDHLRKLAKGAHV